MESEQWSATRRSPIFYQLPGVVDQVKPRILRADAGAEAAGYDVDPSQNIPWAGQQWSYKADQGKGHRSGNTSTTLQVINGQATVPMRDSEAVIVSL